MRRRRPFGGGRQARRSTNGGPASPPPPSLAFKRRQAASGADAATETESDEREKERAPSERSCRGPRRSPRRTGTHMRSGRPRSPATLLDRRGNTVATSSSSTASSVLFSVGTVHKEDLCGDAAAADPLPAVVVAVAGVGDVAVVEPQFSDRVLRPSVCGLPVSSSAAQNRSFWQPRQVR